MKIAQTKLLMFFTVALLIGTLIPDTFAEVCQLCPDGSFPQFPTSKLVLNNAGTVINCTHAYNLAPTDYFDNCTDLHIRSEICGCGDPGDQKCTLCENGDLPDPGLEIGEMNCSEWEKKAAGRFFEDCPTWQQTFGIACGCNNTKSDDFCNICQKDLPFIEKEVRFTDNSRKTCLQIEQESNVKISLNQVNCTGEQAKFDLPCDCNLTPSPTPASSSLFGIQTIPVAVLSIVFTLVIVLI